MFSRVLFRSPDQAERPYSGGRVGAYRRGMLIVLVLVVAAVTAAGARYARRG